MSADEKLDVYTKVSDMSKYLRKSIEQMPKYYRYDIGDEIKKLLRYIKFKAYSLQWKDCSEELYFMLQHLKILLDECIDDGILLMSGKYTIFEPRKIYKSLFHVPKTKGLAIGNLTSQMFANFYLTPMDIFIIYVLGLLIHVRYADDFVDGHDDLKYLLWCIPLIKLFAKQELLLTIHPDKLYIQECHKGVSFIGGNIKPHRIYCGNRALSKFYDALNTKYADFDESKIDNYISSVNSYLGLIRHFKTYSIRKRYINKYTKPWRKNFTVGKGYIKIIKKSMN